MSVAPLGNRTRHGARLMLEERWEAPPSPTKVRWRKCLPAANRKKKQMKKTVISMALAIAAPFAWAQVSETTTTTTTTEGNGTITEYTPGSAIVLKETSGPRTYHFGKTVTYVTRSGKVLDEDTLRTRVRVGTQSEFTMSEQATTSLLTGLVLDED